MFTKSSEVLPDICQADWMFLQDRMKDLASVIKLISTDFNHQFAKTFVLIYSESKRKWKLNHRFNCFSLFLFCFFFCENSVTVNGNTEWFPLGRPYWICSFRHFLIHSRYLKETVKDCYNLWRKLALSFLNVIMDICYRGGHFIGLGAWTAIHVIFTLWE